MASYLADNKLYCGYTDDLEKRFENHLNCIDSKFTKANKPVEIV